MSSAFGSRRSGSSHGHCHRRRCERILDFLRLVRGLVTSLPSHRAVRKSKMASLRSSVPGLIPLQGDLTVDLFEDLGWLDLCALGVKITISSWVSRVTFPSPYL